MITLGNRLRTIREEKGFSIDYVSRETNISSKYLEALEREDFSSFPSEPYVLGFLRNYAEFLGISQEEISSLYRSQKIQDQPVPMEQLLHEPSQLPKIIVILAIIILILALGVGAYFFISRFPQRVTLVPEPARTASEYVMTTDFFERRFYPGDSLLVSTDTDTYRLHFISIRDAVTISTPLGTVILDLGQESTVDINDSAFSRLRIIATDFVRNDSQSGALLRFEREAQPQALYIPPIPDELRAARETATVIFNSPSPMPFTLQAVFNNYCLFRHEVLFEPNRPGRVEQYYQRHEEISITARDGVRLGMSNAQAVRLQAIVGGRVLPFDAGGAGEVVAADLRWVIDEDNRFSLVLLRLE